MKKVFAVILIGLLTVNTPIISNATEKENFNVTSNETVTQNGIETGKLEDVVILPNSEYNDKEEYLKEVDEYIDGQLNNGFSSRALSVNLVDKNQVNANGSYIYAKFDSTVTYGVFTDLRVNGSSRIYWGGTNPIRCTKIKMEDSFVISGVTVGFSFSSDGKWSVTPGVVNATATWSDSYNDEYAIDHVYSNLDFNGYEVYLKQSTTGYFTFSTTTYQTTAVDSSLL